MAVYYLDTSAVLKCYVLEPGTAWMRSLADPIHGHALYIARIAAIETVEALTRRGRHPGFPPARAALAVQAFKAEMPRRFSLVEMTPVVFSRSLQIAETHGLRGYDAVHLASALAIHTQALSLGLPAIILVSADLELNAVAASEGLPVENLDQHP